MKNKIFIAIIILITICSCSKEDSNMRLEEPKLTPKELIVGKWHSFNPNYWVFDISTNYITYYTGTKWTVNSINDSMIWFRRDRLEVWNFTISKNGDTLYIKELVNSKFIRFKN